MAIYLLKNNKYFLHSVKQVHYNVFFLKSKYIFTKISFFMAFFIFQKIQTYPLFPHLLNLQKN